MRRRGRRVLLWAGVGAAAGAVVLLLGLAGDVVLPRLVARVIAAQLAGRTAAGNVQVEVESRPAWRLLYGEASYLHLDLRDARFGQLPVNSFLLDAHDLALDPGRLWRRGEIVLRRHGPLRATLRLTEADLNRYLWATADRDRAFRLVLGRDTVTAEGSLALLGQRIPLRLQGRFRVEPPLTLRYVPEEFFLARVPIPKPLLENAVAEVFAVQLRVEDLPVRVRLTDVRVEPGRLFLFASGVSGQ
ncbi:MAG: DUF2993 domain-containing protein [Bacillota bacterium]|nr:DUF2993 domain-containing protein [Bacillota bacterium]